MWVIIVYLAVLVIGFVVCIAGGLWMAGDYLTSRNDPRAEKRVSYKVGWLRLTRLLRMPFMALGCWWYDLRQPRPRVDVVGYKWAFVVPSQTSGYEFAPMRVGQHNYTHREGNYPSVARAYCRGYHFDQTYFGWLRCAKSPNLERPRFGSMRFSRHKCGFHALKRRRDLGRIPWGYPDLRRSLMASVVVLQVDLRDGLVVPGRYGWRGERQSVLKVEYGRRCAACIMAGRRSRRPTGLKTIRHQIRGRGFKMVTAACADHADPSITFATLRDMLGTEVGWGA